MPFQVSVAGPPLSPIVTRSPSSAWLRVICAVYLLRSDFEQPTSIATSRPGAKESLAQETAMTIGFRLTREPEMQAVTRSL